MQWRRVGKGAICSSSQYAAAWTITKIIYGHRGNVMGHNPLGLDTQTATYVLMPLPSPGPISTPPYSSHVQIPTNTSYLALLVKLLQGSPAAMPRIAISNVAVEEIAAATWVVKHKEVQIISSQVLQAAFHSCCSTLEAMIPGVEFADQVHLSPQRSCAVPQCTQCLTHKVLTIPVRGLHTATWHLLNCSGNPCRASG